MLKSINRNSLSKFLLLTIVLASLSSQARPRIMGDWESSGTVQNFSHRSPSKPWTCQIEILEKPATGERALWVANFVLDKNRDSWSGQQSVWEKIELPQSLAEGKSKQVPPSRDIKLARLNLVELIDEEGKGKYLVATFSLSLQHNSIEQPQSQSSTWAIDEGQISMRSQVFEIKLNNGDIGRSLSAQVFCQLLE